MGDGRQFHVADRGRTAGQIILRICHSMRKPAKIHAEASMVAFRPGIPFLGDDQESRHAASYLTLPLETD